LRAEHGTLSTGDRSMALRNLITKRPIVVTLTVLALVVLSAGVVSAAGAKAKFTAHSDVALVGLDPGNSAVESVFKTKKNGTIQSVRVNTFGEGVFGATGGMVMDACEEKGKHSAGACVEAGAILNGGTAISVHNSTAKLKVVYQDEYNLVGTLKGRLNAEISLIAGDGSGVFVGPGSLRIRSTELPSIYGCIVLDPGAISPANPNGIVPLPIATCQATEGPQIFGLQPTLVPLELHVRDTGRFDLDNAVTGDEIRGKLEVTVDSVGGVTTGQINVTKGKLILVHDHD